MILGSARVKEFLAAGISIQFVRCIGHEVIHIKI
jgi:hypothetical protein